MENPFTRSEEEYEVFNLEESTGNLSYSDIAVKLLKDKLWLTALELHIELIEAGKEVPKLREFFSNPVNFENQSRVDILSSIPRSSSQATLDSLDMTRYSEDGERITNEKVAVLEFELRKAKETINALRANLTVATTVEGNNCLKDGQCDVIKPHEQRALNFLINEYLLMRGYKLTSITFADENEEQDFEDWDDVGLNMPKPSELLHFYRIGIKETQTFSVTVETQTDPIPKMEDLMYMKEKVENLEEENAKLNDQNVLKAETCSMGTQCDEVVLEGSKNELIANKSDISGSFEELNQTELDNSKLCLLNETLDMDIEVGDDVDEIDVSSPDLSSLGKREETPSVISSEGSPKPTVRQAPLKYSGFEGEVWSHLPQVRALEGLSQVSNEGLVLTLGQNLSSILQQLPNNKEWLPKVVPILVCMIRLHPDEKTKDSLIHCLLNLKKRPTQEDRNVILGGIVKLCEGVEDESINSQVLSHCWETMGHKYPEKRVLVAQACAHLSPIISSELRDSLLISMLKQLLEDRDDGVRAHSVTSLAVIACQITSDKYSEVEELTLKGLLDRSEGVVRVTQSILLPVTAHSALHRNIIHTHLIANSLLALDKMIQKQEKDLKCCNLLNGLAQVLPHIVMFAATADTVIESISANIPPPQFRMGFTNVCKGLSNPVLFYEDHSVGAVIGAFDYCLQQLSPWPQLSWVIDVLIPKVLKILDKVSSEKEELVMSFVRFFVTLTAGFGTVFTTQHVKGIFLDKLTSLDKSLIQIENECPPLSIIPVFCLGILAPLQCCEEELGQVLGRLLTSLGLSSAPLCSLHLTVRHLAEGSKHSNTVMSALWQGVVHPNAGVKKATSELLMDSVPHCSEQVISARIIPALITLASDPDISVRLSTLPVYALTMEHSKNKEVLDKIYLQVQSIINDPTIRENVSTLVLVITSLTKMGTQADPGFREDTIFVEFDKMTKAGFDLKESNRFEVAAALVEAFSHTMFCDISKNCMNTTFLPTLRLLETFCQEVLPTHTPTVSEMIKEIEARIGTSIPTSSSRSSTISLGAITPTNVEEMKQRVTKMFNSPISKTSNIQNIFWKK